MALAAQVQNPLAARAQLSRAQTSARRTRILRQRIPGPYASLGEIPETRFFDVANEKERAVLDAKNKQRLNKQRIEALGRAQTVRLPQSLQEVVNEIDGDAAQEEARSILQEYQQQAEPLRRDILSSDRTIGRIAQKEYKKLEKSIATKLAGAAKKSGTTTVAKTGLKFAIPATAVEAEGAAAFTFSGPGVLLAMGWSVFSFAFPDSKWSLKLSNPLDWPTILWAVVGFLLLMVVISIILFLFGLMGAVAYGGAQFISAYGDALDYFGPLTSWLLPLIL